MPRLPDLMPVPDWMQQWMCLHARVTGVLQGLFVTACRYSRNRTPEEKRRTVRRLRMMCEIGVCAATKAIGFNGSEPIIASEAQKPADAHRLMAMIDNRSNQFFFTDRAAAFLFVEKLFPIISCHAVVTAQSGRCFTLRVFSAARHFLRTLALLTADRPTALGFWFFGKQFKWLRQAARAAGSQRFHRVIVS